MLSRNQLRHAIRHVFAAREASKDTTKVGAAIVDAEGIVLLTAYNGVAKGVHDFAERRTRENGEKYLWAAHAEQNAIAFAARRGIRIAGCAIVVSHQPCNECARLLIQAGVRVIYHLNGETSMPDRQFRAARIMCEEAGVPVRHIDVDLPEKSQPVEWNDGGFDFWTSPRD